MGPCWHAKRRQRYGRHRPLHELHVVCRETQEVMSADKDHSSSDRRSPVFMCRFFYRTECLTCFPTGACRGHEEVSPASIGIEARLLWAAAPSESSSSSSLSGTGAAGRWRPITCRGDRQANLHAVHIKYYRTVSSDQVS